MLTARLVLLFLLLACWVGGTPANSAASPGPYNIRAAHSGKCMDVVGGPPATANGIGVQQYDCLGTGQTNQWWSFTPTGDGATFYVKAVHSGRCLDVRGGPGATQNGAALQQWDCLGYAQANQRFRVVASGDGSTFYLEPAHSGKCVDVTGGPPATANGAPVQQYDCLGYAQSNQRWYFTKGDPGPVVPDLDGDGSDAAHDCNDAASDIHPGAPETPSDGIDQDCDGSDAPIAPGSGGGPTTGPQGAGSAEGQVGVLFVGVVNLWTLSAGKTRVERLGLRGAPSGTAVTITCRGRGCPFARRVRRAPTGRVNLQRPFKRRPLGAATVIRLRLDMPRVGRYEIRFRTRADALPKRTDYCPSPRETKLRRCA